MMAYKPMYETKDEDVFEVVGIYLDEWKYFCTDAQEIIPRHMSEQLGNYVVIKAYVDSNHAGNMANRVEVSNRAVSN